MKFPIVLLAVLTFSNPILGYALRNGFSPEHSLSNRALVEAIPEGEHEGKPVNLVFPVPEPPDDYDPAIERPPPGQGQPEQSQPKGGVLAGAIATYQSVMASLRNLKTPQWITDVMAYAQKNTPKWVTNTLSKAQAQAQALGSMISSRLATFKSQQPVSEADPENLFVEVDANGYGIISTDGEGYPLPVPLVDLTEHLDELEKLEDEGDGGSVYEYGYSRAFYQLDPVTRKYKTGEAWIVEYYSRKDAITHFVMNGIVIPRVRPDQIGLASRSVPLSDLNGSPSTNSTENQTPAALFEQYVELYFATQTAISNTIRPVLDNITHNSNSTLIAQMAESVYYDITGSTTALIGPFNNGMSFVNNKTMPANATNLVKAMETVYTGMWMQALMAANSTGMYGQQMYLASILNTNDTSVYPPGYTDVVPHG